jgi:hypothetical protein
MRSRNLLRLRTTIEYLLILITGIGRKRGDRSRNRTGSIWLKSPRNIQKLSLKCRWQGLMLADMSARKALNRWKRAYSFQRQVIMY